MAKLTTNGYELLPPGVCVVEADSAELVAGEYNGEKTQQIKLELEVAEGEHKGYTFLDYPNRDADGSIKPKTKAWDIFESCLRTKLSPDEDLDTDDLVGKRFMAQVVVKKTGTGNCTEHGPIGPVPPEAAEEAPRKPRQPVDDLDDEFDDIRY